jgi:hypothetical protein
MRSRQRRRQLSQRVGLRAIRHSLTSRPVAPIEMDHLVDEFDQMTEGELSAWFLEKASELGIKFVEA